jgi:predicted ATPase/DNA-binding winged helix-turn-helix (wHTH) protein
MPVPYRFGRFEVRCAERQLLIDGKSAVLGARAFDLMLALIERRDRTVGKNELLDLVWPGLVVEENNLQVHVSALRKLLGPQAIATIPGRGYRFTAMLDGDSAVAAAVPPPAISRTPGNLPAHLPPLIGRAEELRALLAQIETNRLLTVVGAAGVGKTALATAAAHASRHRWRDGAWLVDLAPLTEAVQLPHAVAQALCIPLGGLRPAAELLVGVLQSQSLLLLLDNCEHLVAAVATLAATLVAQAPGVHVLATSQELLEATGEKIFKLDPLALPPADAARADAASFGALQLFAERAQAVDPRFSLGASNIEAVADICHHLDGLPLAIELAAARVHALGVQGVRARLGERFRLLTGGARTTMRRHQTLQAALDWSHALLSAQEQTVFRRLGAFLGGFTLELAQQVAGEAQLDEWAVLDALSALVDKSMVAVQDGDTPRYALLETTRAYALQMLAQAGETGALRQRHARAVLALFERADEERFGEQGTLSEDSYIERLLPEFDNLRAALAWAEGNDGHQSLAIALAGASAAAFFVVGRAAESSAVLRRLMPHVTPETDPMLAARFWFAVVQIGHDDRIEDDAYVQAIERAERLCRRLGWLRRLHGVLVRKAFRHVRHAESAAADEAHSEAARIAQPSWPGWLHSDRLSALTLLYAHRREFERAGATYESIGTWLPPVGETYRRMRLTNNAAAWHSDQQQWDRAVALLEPLVDQARSQRQLRAWAYGNLVSALTQLGRLADARTRLREALPLWRADGIVHVWLHAAIRLAVAEQRIADAMRLVGAEEASARQFGRADPLVVRVRSESLRLIEAAAPDPAQRERWRREGAALDEAAVAVLCLGAAGATPIRSSP